MNNAEKKMDLGMEPIIDLIWEEEEIIPMKPPSQIWTNCSPANGFLPPGPPRVHTQFCG